MLVAVLWRKTLVLDVPKSIPTRHCPASPGGSGGRGTSARPITASGRPAAAKTSASGYASAPAISTARAVTELSEGPLAGAECVRSVTVQAPGVASAGCTVTRSAPPWKT